MDDVLEVPQGRFVLRRAHHRDGDPLRAWDAADDYVAQHVHEAGIEGQRWLVIDDSSGALAVALAGHHPQVWCDSHVTRLTIAANLVGNGLAEDAVELVHGDDVPVGPIDVAIIKVPKALAHLEDRLRRLRPLLHASSVVIGAGMTKSIHNSTTAAFASTVGPTTTTLARRKARLIESAVDGSMTPAAPRDAASWATEDGVLVTARTNVFSASGLDFGTRLLLAHLPSPPPGGTVVDLGCGSGVVGATVALRHPDAEIVCCDESDQAVASARDTVGRVTDRATFHVTDVLDGIADASAAMVVVNPPFHAGGARTPAVATRMFAESARVLRPGGHLVVVGNRHLGYHRVLTRWFGDVTQLGSDARFVLLQARR